MRARKLMHKVTIQQATDTLDSAGEPIQTWATYATRSAEVMPMGGRETFRLQQYYADATAVIRLRYDSLTKAITPEMRVSFDSRIFNIESMINVDELNREIKLVCKENV
jgi:SPP1 family predicted phage head-tail adaptor